MPPLPANVIENAVPTAPVRVELVVVTAGAAGMVMVAVPDLLESATEVAVMVADCEELVAAGAVYVAELVVVFDKVPSPLKVHLTPPEFLSWVTAAVSVVVSLPSTVLAAAVTATLIGLELPPHPVKAASKANKDNAENMMCQEELRRYIDPPRAHLRRKDCLDLRVGPFASDPPTDLRFIASGAPSI